MLTMTMVLETLASGSTVASILEFPQHRVECHSHSREDAIAQIRADATTWLDRVEILPLELDSPPSESPWIKYAGMFKGDPDFAKIAAAIRAERDNDDESEVDPSVYTLV